MFAAPAVARRVISLCDSVSEVAFTSAVSVIPGSSRSRRSDGAPTASGGAIDGSRLPRRALQFSLVEADRVLAKDLVRVDANGEQSHAGCPDYHVRLPSDDAWPPARQSGRHRLVEARPQPTNTRRSSPWTASAHASTRRLQHAVKSPLHVLTLFKKDHRMGFVRT